MKYVNKSNSMLVVNENGAWIKVAPKGVIELAQSVAAKYLQYLMPAEKEDSQPKTFQPTSNYKKVENYSVLSKATSQKPPAVVETPIVVIENKEEKPIVQPAQFDDNSLNKLADMLASKLAASMPQPVTQIIHTNTPVTNMSLDISEVKPILGELNATSNIKTEVEVKESSDSISKLNKLKEFRKNKEKQDI